MKRILIALCLALSVLVGTVGTASTADAATKRRCHIDIWLTPFDPADGDNGWYVNSRLTRQGVPMAGKLVWYQKDPGDYLWHDDVTTHTMGDGTAWSSYSWNYAHGDSGAYMRVVFYGNKRTKACHSNDLWIDPR